MKNDFKQSEERSGESWPQEENDDLLGKNGVIEAGNDDPIQKDEHIEANSLQGEANDGRDEGGTGENVDPSAPVTPEYCHESQPEPTGLASSEPQNTVGDGKIKVYTLADAMCEEDHFAKNQGDKLYVSQNGVYVPTGLQWVKYQTKILLLKWGMPDQWSSNKAVEVSKYIRDDAPGLWERPPLDTLNVLNGLLDLNTRQLRPHDPAFLSPIQIPVFYDPNADCPEWREIASQTFPSDAPSLPWEIAALLMQPYTALQKAFLLLGGGNNGKSRILNGYTAFLGKKNCSALSLHKLESHRFALSRLVGKLANICADLPSKHLSGTSVFKSIVGGEFAINAEYKFGADFDFDCFARLVFSANIPPPSPDSSEGFFRRWIVIPFDHDFTGKEISPDVIDARLSDPRELSGLLNLALDAWPQVRNYGITESPSMRRAFEEFRAATDPFTGWLNRATVLGPDVILTKDRLHKAYDEDCRVNKRTPPTKTAFGAAMKKARPGLKEAQRTVEGKVQWCWIGIGLKEPDEGI